MKPLSYHRSWLNAYSFERHFPRLNLATIYRCSGFFKCIRLMHRNEESLCRLSSLLREGALKLFMSVESKHLILICDDELPDPQHPVLTGQAMKALEQHWFPRVTFRSYRWSR